MSLRYAGQCGCGTEIAKGQKAGWDRGTREVICLPCLDLAPAGVIAHAVIEAGVPGGSLQREYERRMAKREARVVGRFPKVGRIILKIFGPAHTTKAFIKGADGEREVAALLETKLGQNALFLYNRRRGLGRERGDIDMLIVVASGVYIIDPKKYVGRKVRANRSRDMFIVDGRKRPHLAESMRRQVDVVTAAMQASPVPGVLVTAAYCFLGADLPWGTLRVDGVVALGKRSVVKMLRRPGTLDVEQRRLIQRFLSERFPPA